jgi:hypothetical protein
MDQCFALQATNGARARFTSKKFYLGETMTPWHFRIIFIASGILLLVAVTDLPYLLYKPIKVCVLVAAIFLAVRAVKVGHLAWLAPAAISFVLFTPAFGFDFAKPIWVLVDLVFGVIYLVASIILGKPYKIQPTEQTDDDSDFDFGNDYGYAIKETEPFELEDNQPNLWLAVLLTGLVVLFIFGTIGQPIDETGCENWVSDERGGYCE